MQKPAALAELTTISGMTVVFSPEKATAVYWAPQIADPLSDNVRSVESAATHVYGITIGAQVVAEPPDAFLAKLGIADQFFTATTIYGPIRIRALAVSWLMSKYPDEDNPRLKCFLGPGPSAADPWRLIEDMTTIRKLIDDIRLRPEAGAAGV